MLILVVIVSTLTAELAGRAGNILSARHPGAWSVTGAEWQQLKFITPREAAGGLSDDSSVCKITSIRAIRHIQRNPLRYIVFITVISPCAHWSLRAMQLLRLGSRLRTWESSADSVQLFQNRAIFRVILVGKLFIWFGSWR